jgi:hypothetical protein
MTEPTNLDVSWSVVFRLDDNDDWHDWTRNHADVSDAVKSAEVLVKTPPVVEIRFDRITVQRERFSLTELSAAEPATPVGPAPDNRAAVLLWAADQIDAGWFTTAATATAELRRLAGEAQQAPCGRPASMASTPCSAGEWCCTGAREARQDPTQDGEAHPPYHRWYVETRDGVADQWAPGMRFTDRAKAVERYQALSENHPTWYDGTPVERRIVRETTTYSVEEPAAVARPGQPETDTTPPA